MKDHATVLLCSMRVGDQVLGIDTQKVHAVLGEKMVHPVPLTPPFVGGVLAYRGDVLLVLCLRRLLGMPPLGETASVLVLRDEQEDEPFGLAVDSVEDVLTLSARDWEENPCTLDDRRKNLFAGAYKVRDGLVVRLEPEMLCPSRLEEIFASGWASEKTLRREMCAH